jgi:hypothetical protein
VLEQTTVTGSDDWWVMRLAEKLGRGLPRLGELRGYADGTCLLPYGADQLVAESVMRFIRMSRLNLAELVVSARTDRMRPTGFRTAAVTTANSDSVAWSTWKRSGMKAGARKFFRSGLTYGSSYLTVTGSQQPSSTAQPMMLQSTPWDTVTEQSAAQPWLAQMALQVGFDPIAGAEVLTLFGPGFMRQAYRQARVPSLPNDGTLWMPGNGWTWSSDRRPLGYTQEVPVVRFSTADGKGVFETHTDALDRVNHTIMQRLEIIAYQAFRQMVIKGEFPEFYPATHPLAGQKINYDERFRSGPGSVWFMPQGADVWQSQATSSKDINDAIASDIKFAAAVMRTPAYMLTADSANQSAEGASLAREALVFAVEELIDQADLALAQAQSIAFQALGDEERAQVAMIEPIWAPVDRSSIIERAQSAQAAKQGGLSQQMIDEKIFQLSPDEMDQEQQNLSDELFTSSAQGV